MSKKEVDIEPAHKVLWNGLRLLIWMCVILGVLLTGNFVRSFILQNQIERTETAVAKTEHVASGAKASADAALEELRAAIKAIRDSKASEPALTNQAIISALQAITRIEAFVCSGPCPDPAQKPSG